VVPIFFNRRPDAAPGCPHITNDPRSRRPTETHPTVDATYAISCSLVG